MTQSNQITTGDLPRKVIHWLAVREEIYLLVEVNPLTKSIIYVVREPSRANEMRFADLQEAIAYFNKIVGSI